MASEIRVIGVEGIPEARAGDNPAALIIEALQHQGLTLAEGDVVVVTHKFVSKAEGRVIQLDGIEPSAFAIQFAERTGKDPRHVEVVLREAHRIVRMDRALIIAETRHGFICANAGVDASNVAGAEAVSLLPLDPDASAEQIRQTLCDKFGLHRLGVIITDTFGRPWRRGQVNIAVGVAGMGPLRDYRGQFDDQGYEMHVTVIAVADELASTAELVMGKLDRVPVALVRGYDWSPPEEGDPTGAAGLVMSPERDLFR